MTLSEKDGQLFYKLWLPLLDYVNEKCKVNKNVKDMANAKSLNPQEVKEIASFSIFGFLLRNTKARLVKYANATPAIQRITTAICIMTGLSTFMISVQIA